MTGIKKPPLAKSHAATGGRKSQDSRRSKYMSMKSMRNLKPWLKDADSNDVQDIIDLLSRIKHEKQKAEYSIPDCIPVDDYEQYLNGEYYDRFTDQLPLVTFRQESGVGPDDLMNALCLALGGGRLNSSLSVAKYRYHDNAGRLCEWSGQGRVPRSFSSMLLKTGKNREDFRIQSSRNDESCTSPVKGAQPAVKDMSPAQIRLYRFLHDMNIKPKDPGSF